MRIVFMGTGEIALPTLQWLLDHVGGEGADLVAVYTQPDRPVGRKQILTPSAIKVLALERGCPVLQPERLKGNETVLGEFIDLRPDLAVIMAYGQILPRTFIRTPALGCVNLHASLLPRHRGAAPIQAAIRDGDVESGITLMHVVPQLDAGGMILKKCLPIRPNDTGGSLHDRLAELGPEILAEGLRLFRRGNPPAIPQDEGLVTHTGKLGREDGEIDWSRDALSLERLIRAYDPWPGTTTGLVQGGETKKLKIHPPSRVLPSAEAAPGAVLSSGSSLVVQTGDGALELCGDFQLEGRKRLPVAEFLRGVPISVGTILGSGEIAV